MNLAQRIKSETGCSARDARTLAAAIVRRDEWAVKDNPLVTERVCYDGCCSYGYEVKTRWGRFPVLNERMRWEHG